jgi:ABC-type polysaccharide/polyol phosphate export permease
MSAIFKQIKLLIQYRHLVFDLAIKDIKVRYRSPVLGFFWSILIPLVTVFIFKFVFSTLMQVKVENYPFFIYLSTAVFPWTCFSSSISGATESILSNRELIKKTYFPRQVIPVSVVLANLINFIPALAAMLLILVFFRMKFTAWILLLPIIVLLQTLLAIGLALIFCSLQVVLRDVKYIVELLLMVWMYLSPVFYPLSMIANFSAIMLKLYLVNPFVGLFCLYRLALLEGFIQTLPAGVNIWALSLWTTGVCISVFLLGFLVFRKYEAYFSDLV